MATATVGQVRNQPKRQTTRARRSAASNFALILAINETGYAVRPLSVESEAALRAYELTKSDATAYHVSQHAHGCECTCPDFVYRRAGLDPTGCKHIKALDQYKLIENRWAHLAPVTMPTVSTAPF